jgi:hypothetical protein
MGHHTVRARANFLPKIEDSVAAEKNRGLSPGRYFATLNRGSDNQSADKCL